MLSCTQALEHEIANWKWLLTRMLSPTMFNWCTLSLKFALHQLPLSNAGFFLAPKFSQKYSEWKGKFIYSFIWITNMITTWCKHRIWQEVHVMCGVLVYSHIWEPTQLRAGKLFLSETGSAFTSLEVGSYPETTCCCSSSQFGFYLIPYTTATWCCSLVQHRTLLFQSG